MNGIAHDGGLLLLTVVIDAAILAGWWFLARRLLSPAEIPTAGADDDAEAGWLDRASTWICGILLVGLIVEVSGLMVVIVSRYGFVE